jgi:hypothetical protein
LRSSWSQRAFARADLTSGPQPEANTDLTATLLRQEPASFEAAALICGRCSAKRSSAVIGLTQRGHEAEGDLHDGLRPPPDERQRFTLAGEGQLHMVIIGIRAETR